MTTLAELQARLQASVLGNDSACLDLIARPPRDTADIRFGVYRNAYRLRLAEFLANDHEKLKLLIGEDRFAAMARAYMAATPSDQPNARWYSRHLPEFLRRQVPYRDEPVLGDLASLERALNDAFDSPDVETVCIADLAAIAPEKFPSAQLNFHPSIQLIDTVTSIAPLWSALKNGEAADIEPPAAEPATLLVWRQASASKFRALGDEEKMALIYARDGIPFGPLCEMIAVMADPESAAMRAATYLRGWIEAEMICAIETGGQATS